MNKILLILAAAALPFTGNAQTFTPSASQGVPGGAIGQTYSSSVDIGSVPSSSTIGLADLGLPGAITALLPAGVPSTFTLTVSSVEFTCEGLPTGLSGGPVSINAGASGTLDIAGTPTTSGDFAMDIVSATTGQADIGLLLNALDGIPGAALALAAAGITNPYTLPQAIPGLSDEGTYNMFISDPNGIQNLDSETFGLTFLGEHPFKGATEMAISVPQASKVRFEVIDINGRIVSRFDIQATQGINKFTLAPEVGAGTYMLRSSFEGQYKMLRFLVID